MNITSKIEDISKKKNELVTDKKRVKRYQTFLSDMEKKNLIINDKYDFPLTDTIGFKKL